ncbi:MAG: hypothetical protein JRJ12_16100, partial [Deltaproteobacteria bacterium]|nr:hypothetical protein [Deltaproteobacteria bacterium]
MKSRKNICYLMQYTIWSLGLLLITFAPVHCWAATRLTMSFAERPLIEVAREISEQTGYTIVLNEDLNEIPVTARFHQATVDEALRRVLAGFNYALIFEEDLKSISVIILNPDSNS